MAQIADKADAPVGAPWHDWVSLLCAGAGALAAIVLTLMTSHPAEVQPAVVILEGPLAEALTVPIEPQNDAPPLEN